MSAGFWIAQGQRHVVTGDFEAAATAFDNALATDPSSAIALGGLGHCLGRIGRRSEACGRLTQAARLLGQRARRAADAGPLLDVAQELHALRAFQASLPPIERALRLAPTDARCHYLHAHALWRLRRLEDARLSAGRAVALAPHASNARIFLATLEAEAGDLDAARRRLEGIVGRDGDPNVARAEFELGRILDRLGECDRAFECFASSGRRQLARPELARHRLGSLVEELGLDRERCTPAWFERWRGLPADGSPDPVFLVGFYRSGTTLLEQMLAAHPAVQSSDEADLMPQVAKALHRMGPPGAHWTERIEAAGIAGIARLRRHFWSAAEAAIDGPVRTLRLIDKTALNTVNLGLLRTLFPTAPVIFALRDPRDACLSAFMQAFVPNALTTHCLDWDRLAQFYDVVMTHWKAMAPRLSPAPVVVRYESLVADPRDALQPVLALLGLDWDGRMDRFHERAAARTIATPSFADVARPVHGGARGRWRRYASRFDAVADRLAPHLRDFGYP